MRPLLSPREMAEADAVAVSSGTPVHILMERAGRAVARKVIRVVGTRYGTKVVVVCGKGNNGGDGLVAGRVLAREGFKVVCSDGGTPFEAEGAPLHHLGRLRRQGLEVRPFDASLLDQTEVVVDALFGTGFRGAVEGAPAKVVDAVNACSAAVIAVDIPSGVDGMTGAVQGPAVRASATVALGAEKVGTALAPGAAYAGSVEVVDIGISIPEVDVHLAEARDAARTIPARTRAGHKRSNGSVALLAGSVGMSGAALLCAQGALRAGAGYVTLGTTVEVARAADVVLPEVLTRPLWDGNGMSAVALERFADVVERADALAIGPGLRATEGQRTLVRRVLDTVALPLVVDADGLNVLAGDPTPLKERARPTVITPHPGELARLVRASVGEIQSNRLQATRAAAAELRCVVLLKGFRTVVATPEGRAVVVPTGGPELATAGTGDVLAGVVVTLLAQGLDPFDAAWLAAYVHGAAGAIAGAGSRGRGVLAWDVAEALPDAFAELVPPA